MSIPGTTEEEVYERRWDGPLSDVEAPVVEGDDSYTAMIRSLLFLADCRNNEGDRVTPPSFELVHQRTANWMENKAHTPKFVEDETLESLLAFVMRFENPRSMARIRAEIEGHGFLLFRARCVKCHRPRVAPVWGSDGSGARQSQSHQSV
jgi:mono/diheme cytochrome c family protein